jgi:hypothetical protein
MTTPLKELTTEAPSTVRPMIALSRRVAVGLGLATVAAIHILDLPGKLAETPYLGVIYIVLIIAAFVLTERLFVVGSRLDFIAAAALSAAVIALSGCPVLPATSVTGSNRSDFSPWWSRPSFSGSPSPRSSVFPAYRARAKANRAS